MNYLRYALFYVEKMRKSPIEYPDIYKIFMKGKSVVKTEIGSFNGVSPDIKLEKTIHSKVKKVCCSLYWSNSAIIICKSTRWKSIFNFTIFKTTLINNGSMCK